MKLYLQLEGACKNNEEKCLMSTAAVMNGLFLAFTAVSGSPSLVKLPRHLESLSISSLLLLDEFRCCTFCCRQIDVSFSLLASMELLLRPNCSLLYLHCNDMLFEKFLRGKNVRAMNYL